MSRQFGDDSIMSVGKRRVRYSGKFYPNGAGAIDNTVNEGKAGWTVAWISTGLYRITLDRFWLKYILLTCQVQSNAAAALFAQFGPIVLSGALPTIDVRVVSGAGAVTDIAANANNSVSFDIECCQDTVLG